MHTDLGCKRAGATLELTRALCGHLYVGSRAWHAHEHQDKHMHTHLTGETQRRRVRHSSRQQSTVAPIATCVPGVMALVVVFLLRSLSALEWKARYLQRLHAR